MNSYLRVLITILAILVFILVIVAIKWFVDEDTMNEQINSKNVDQAVQIVGKATDCRGTGIPVLYQDYSGTWYAECKDNRGQ